MQTVPYDVYTNFTTLLDFNDLRSFCQANPRMCELNPKIKHKLLTIYKDTNKILNILDSGVEIFLLHHEGIKFGIFHDIMKMVGLYEPPDEDDEENIYPSDIQNNLYIINITVLRKSANLYSIVYTNYKAPRVVYGGLSYTDQTTFYGDRHQLKEFLLQLFYNNLITPY